MLFRSRFPGGEGKSQVITFVRGEQNSRTKDRTHGEVSHLIKHLIEFEKIKVEDVLSRVLDLIIKKQDNPEQGDTEGVFIQDVSNNVVAEGADAINLVNYSNTINTLDRINDKSITNMPLYDIEKDIMGMINGMKQLYKTELDRYVKSKDTFNLEGSKLNLFSKIKIVKDRKKIIYFKGRSRGQEREFYFNPQDTGIVIINAFGKVNSFYRIDKKGNSLARAFHEIGGQITSPVVKKVLGLAAK